MFLLTVIEDKLKIPPDQFDRDPLEALKEEIDIKFSDKILLDIGLCICVYDFLNIGDPYLYPSEGACHILVKFRMVVFRPFVGEVIVGRIFSISKTGIRVTLDFFDDIVLPPHLWQSHSEFNEETGTIVWKYSEETEDDFVMQQGDEVRFRVRSINFTRLTSTAKGLQATTTTETHGSESRGVIHARHRQNSEGGGGGGGGGGEPNEAPPPMLRRRSSSSLGLREDEAPSAMQIVGCINEDGLGLVSWWT